MKLEIAFKSMAGIALVLTVSVLAASESLRQHAAHVHGEATGTLSLDNGHLRLELELPGYNLVGFEHPPRHPEQAASLQQTAERLGEGSWLAVDSRAGCALIELKARAHGYDEPAKDDRHGHDHDHHHDHHHHHHHHKDSDHDHAYHESDHHPVGDHDQAYHNGGDHASFQVLAEWDCQRPDRLAWLDLNLFEDFPNQSTITVDVLTDRMATRARLRPDAIRIGFTAP